jgi:alkylation response protein AidB-like acyl-CoA dehydrogenase
MTVPSIDILLIAGRAVFLVFSFVFAAIAFTAWRRATQQQTQHLLTHTDLVLQRLAHLEARIDATKLSVSELGARVERPTEAAAAAPTAAPGYQLAIRLAKGGASREELMSGCGLSLTEADLVQRLHAPAVGYVTNS